MSRSSSSFLIDWRPSRLLCAARATLCLLALASLALSALPAPLAASLGLLLAGWTFVSLARELRRPGEILRISDDGAWAVLLEAGRPPRLYQRARVRVRGPLASLEIRDSRGGTRRWNWWPDTLGQAGRRSLRLAAGNPIGNSGPALATMSG